LGFVSQPNLLTSHYCAISETQQNGRRYDHPLYLQNKKAIHPDSTHLSSIPVFNFSDIINLLAVSIDK
jgi:hypothetical protein